MTDAKQKNCDPKLVELNDLCWSALEQTGGDFKRAQAIVQAQLKSGDLGLAQFTNDVIQVTHDDGAYAGRLVTGSSALN